MSSVDIKKESQENVHQEPGMTPNSEMFDNDVGGVKVENTGISGKDLEIDTNNSNKMHEGNVKLETGADDDKSSRVKEVLEEINKSEMNNIKSEEVASCDIKTESNERHISFNNNNDDSNGHDVDDVSKEHKTSTDIKAMEAVNSILYPKDRDINANIPPNDCDINANIPSDDAKPARQPKRFSPEIEETNNRKRKKKSGWAVVPDEPNKNGFVIKTPEEIQADLLIQHQQAATASALANQQHRSRIYVGSLDFSLNEHDIKDVFGAFGQINNIDMPKEGLRSKGFCFVEYSTPEDADMALQMMQNFTLKGRIIKVGRPTATGQITVLPKQMGGVPTATMPVQPAMLMTPVTVTGENDLSRIYIGNVPYNFTAEDIRKIFTIFGTIMSCALIPSTEKPGTHKGYGFLEYAMNSEAKLAIDTMNEFEIQGKQLKVNYSTQSHSKPMPLCTPPIGSTMPIPSDDVYSQYANEYNEAPPVDDTPVIMLTNMIAPGEIDVEFSAEVEQEASKYGHVLKVRIQIENNEVRVFVKYASDQEARAAIRSLDGRYFGGRQIFCSKYSEKSFDEGKYDL